MLLGPLRNCGGQSTGAAMASDKEQVFQIRFLVHEGKVIMSFPQPIPYVSFTPEEARGNAAALIKMADELNPAGAAKKTN
jgi:hypothetical protein